MVSIIAEVIADQWRDEILAQQKARADVESNTRANTSGDDNDTRTTNKPE
jgi:hypothetical protein